MEHPLHLSWLRRWLRAPGLLRPVTSGSPLNPAASAVPVAPTLHVTVDPRTLDVAIDMEAISRLEKDQVLSITITGVGRFDYVLDHATRDGAPPEVPGHIHRFLPLRNQSHGSCGSRTRHDTSLLN